MSERVTIMVELELDGVAVRGFPYVREVEVDDLQQFAPYDQGSTGAGVYEALPVERLDPLQLLCVRPSLPVTVRLNGQTDAGIIVHTDGLLLLVDVDLGAGGSLNATVQKAEAETVAIEGFGGGTSVER